MREKADKIGPPPMGHPRRNQGRFLLASIGRCKSCQGRQRLSDRHPLPTSSRTHLYQNPPPKQNSQGRKILPPPPQMLWRVQKANAQARKKQLEPRQQKPPVEPTPSSAWPNQEDLISAVLSTPPQPHCTTVGAISSQVCLIIFLLLTQNKLFKSRIC